MHIRLPPQRFRYLRDGVRGWLYGVITEVQRVDDRFVWRLAYYEIDRHAHGLPCCCGDVDEDPTPRIKAELRGATDFEWLDHDGGWPDE